MLPSKGSTSSSSTFVLLGHRHYWTYSINGKHVSGSWCCSSVSVPCARPLKAWNYQIQRHLLTSPHTHTACLYWQWQILHLNREPTSASSREGSTPLINLLQSTVWTLIYSLSNISQRSVLTYAHRLGVSGRMSCWGSWCFNEGFASSLSGKALPALRLPSAGQHPNGIPHQSRPSPATEHQSALVAGFGQPLASGVVGKAWKSGKGQVFIQNVLYFCGVISFAFGPFHLCLMEALLFSTCQDRKKTKTKKPKQWLKIISEACMNHSVV